MGGAPAQLDRNESPFGVSPDVLRAWERQRTADLRKYGLNRYGDFFQVDMLRALARHHGLTPANYTPLAGPAEAATVLAAALLHRGGELVQSWPTEQRVSRPARAWGAGVRRIPLDGELRQDLDALARAVGPKTRLVHVQNPHDPTGRSFGQSEFERFLDAVAERNDDTYVWVDESYAPYSTRRDFPDSFAIVARDPERSRLVVSRSLTTAHGMDGCPVAYLAASRELTHETEGVTTGVFVPRAYGWSNSEAQVNRMGEKALLALLTPEGEAHLASVRRQNADARQQLGDLLERNAFAVTPSDASFVFARAPEPCAAPTMAEALRARGVLVRSSKAWGPRFRDHVRVSVGRPSEIDRLERALAAERRCRTGERSDGSRDGGGQSGFPRGGVETGYGGSAQGDAGAARRALLAGAAAAAGGAVAHTAAHRVQAAREPGDATLAAAVSRRGFIAGAAAGSAALLWGLGRPATAGGFPPDSFYDTFDLARMIYHENPVGPSPAALEAVRAVIARGPLAARRLQPDDPPELVDATLRYNAPRSQAFGRLRAGNVMLTLGSAEGLFLAADTFVGAGTLVSEWPTYPIIRRRVWQAGGTVVDVPLTKDRKPDYAALERAVDAHPNTGIVHLNVQNNPMGTVVEREEFDAFVRRMFERHPRTLVIADESDREWMDPEYLARTPDFARYILEGRNLIHIQTFSHIFGLTGLRAGYLFAPPHLVERMQPKRIRRPVNVFARAAALASLGDADGQIKRCYPVVAEGRRYIYGELDELGLRYSPSQGQYVFIDTGRSGTAVWATLISLGVLTRYGAEWDMEGWIRVNPGLAEENERFVAALRVALARPDPGNVPELPFPGDDPTAVVTRGLARRLARDRFIRSRAGPLERPYRATPADRLAR